MATSVTDHENVRIITQVVQQTDPQAVASVLGNTSIASQLKPSQSQRLNTLPKALGVVQIVLGAIQICFGIALTEAQKNFKSFTVKSAVYFWIGILLLFSGSLLVEMEKRKHAWLVKASFFAGLLVSVAAVIAVILHVIEILQEKRKGNPCDKHPDKDCVASSQLIIYSLNSVFIILSLLELSAAVTALVTGFKDRRQQPYQEMLM
nr:uncharacterized protein LOC110078334 [Pogona vitticeps]